MAGQPVVLVGLDAFHDPGAIARAFVGTAEVRYAAIATPDLVAEASANADAIVVATHALPGELITSLSKTVKVIGRTGVGVDTVDLVTARQEGITVFNEPSYGELEVASHAIGMLLALQRKFAVADAYVRSGWQGRPPLAPMLPLDELRVGVIGCGRIGRATVERLLHLVGEVLVYDPYLTDVPPGAQRVETLEQLLPDARPSCSTCLSPRAPGICSAAANWRSCPGGRSS